MYQIQNMGSGAYVSLDESSYNLTALKEGYTHHCSYLETYFFGTKEGIRYQTLFTFYVM